MPCGPRARLTAYVAYQSLALPHRFLMPVVDYLIAAGCLPARSGLAYDYILAGDGVFVCASNSLLDVRIPVARATVRGLQPVYAMCTLVQGRVSAHLWDALLHCVKLAHSAGCEILTCT